MRLLSRLLVVFIVCLVAMALPAAPAQANGGPSITLSPSSGVPGTEVTVRGYNFTAGEWVDIYYYLDATNRVRVKEVQATSGATSFTVKFFVPESYKGIHKVRAEVSSTIYADADFTVKPGLTVSPAQGPVGTNVTVKGQGFAENERNIELRYYLNGNYETVKSNIPADANGSWQRSFPIPSSAKDSHKIDARGDSSSLAAVKDATFEVKPGISLNKFSGSVGDNITMTGNGFAAGERDIKILFDGEAVRPEIRADDKGYWKESFEVPEMPKGTYSVTAEGEWTDKEDITPRSFEIKPSLVLSPAEGHVGMDLTVAGRGFAASKDVVIKYEGSQKATTSTNANGSFSGVSFPVPEGIHGEHQVTAEISAKIEATAIFTMESDPPDTPDLISPIDGSRVGFIGTVRPTFVWEEVEDPSGVYYNLQIATSANFTATGGFVNPKVSVPEIVGTNCTLGKKDALPYGTYYWIVQAVDRAGNAGNWTAVYSFRAGLLPLWAFIVIIIAIVAGIGTAVYFFIIRKRVYYY